MFSSRRNLVLVLLLTMVGCSQGAEQGTGSSTTNLYSPKPANLRVLLTDAPIDAVKSVFVNVDHVEMLLEKNGKFGRILLGQGLGAVDLLKFQNGVLLPISDVNLPEGFSVKQIRLILNGTGNFLVKDNGDTCQLQTPSAQKSGVKILLSSPVTFENDFSYSLVIDFDAKKSVILKGNGECLLKPVLKLKSATKIPSDDVGDDGSTGGSGTDLTDGTDGNDDTVDDGYDNTDPDSLPPVYSPDDIANYF